MNTITQEIIKDLEALPPEMLLETQDFIQFLKSKQVSKKYSHTYAEPNGTALVRLMAEASKKNLFSYIEDPEKWQREIRKDRPLPGREK